MSWNMVPGRNREGYPDPTATTALSNVQRSQRGLQSKRAGEHFENLIAASLNWYKDKGVAFVEKTPEPMRPLRPPNRQGQFLACYVKAGQPDFKGTLTGGRAVVFEAKHTDSDRIEYNRLTPEQLSSLSEHYHLGAAAFVVVSFGLQDFYRIPWETWRDMKTIYGRKHIKQPELEPFRVQYIAGVLKLLEGIEVDVEARGCDTCTARENCEKVVLLDMRQDRPAGSQAPDYMPLELEYCSAYEKEVKANE
ncbi:Holliday junction resolvase RecU [Eisenbergiella sp.]